MGQDVQALAGVGELSRQQVASKSTLVSVATNIALTAGQVIAGWLSDSQGLIADGIHSLSDLFADFVVLLANRHSQKEADDDHHYGHLRYETAASLVLGVLLLVVGVGMVINGTRKALDPSLIAQVHGMALWVALSALVAKELLFRYMLRAARKVGSSMLEANAWHARSDAASSLVVAFGIGGNLLGFHLLDPLAALVVGVMVGKMGWTFSWNALHDLMDRAASDEQVARLHECLLATPGVLGLHDLRTRMMGDHIVVDVHLEVDGEQTVRQGHAITVEARRRVVAALPVLYVTTHLDPAGDEHDDA
ncbi:cation diffusion facilitator family transporter [Paludibacterium purpuratum]|uniref:Cation diffusion facilitator family transporter n=1 Tax=Paludibacterium purpuratum TaxID=1144873 RepID=A0A4R7BA68_9NEIS|nr:cation diffusion facilitator family transporter [Paludibacterium purpuratum]TDR81473.1 cation diffusion facilitator family transporter [Paludibacterium purpuratum]